MPQSTRELCGLPTQAVLQEIVWDLLHGMAMPVTKREAGEAVANRLGLSEEQRSLMEPKGQYPYVDWEVGWVLSQLKLTGFLEQPRIGYWQLTDDGNMLPFKEFRRRHVERERAKREARRTRDR